MAGQQPLKARDLVVPGDFSSAAFWMVAAACLPGARLTLLNVGLNPTRTALMDVLIRMGAGISVEPEGEDGGEPRGRMVVEGGRLMGTEILADEIPNLIDEVPILAVAGSLAEGVTSIRNADELRVKETDRIDTTVRNLRLMGGDLEEFDDGMVITGGAQLRGTALESYGDHRIAMSFAIAGLLAVEGKTTIQGTACVATSYPGFAEHLSLLSAS